MIRTGSQITLALLAMIGAAQAGWAGAGIAAANSPTAFGEDSPPWERELPLKTAARDVLLTGAMDARQPPQGVSPGRVTISNPGMHASLWGPPDRVTLSILKDDVWDRRVGVAPVITLAEVQAGAFAQVNQAIDDMPPNHRRPVRGYLPASGGGRVDPDTCWNAYPFPCQKPVGQIILGLDELNGAVTPELKQSCADGAARFVIAKDSARANVEVLLSMTRNVFAIRGHLEGVTAPWLRLFRNEDQAWRRYMTPDKKGFLFFTQSADKRPFDYAADAAWNGPIEPPSSGTDGQFFWVHQRFPAEKTFPKGFDYVLMGLASGAHGSAIQSTNGGLGLGTPPFAGGGGRSSSEDPFRSVRETPGAAATAFPKPDAHGEFTVYIAVVTLNEATDFMHEARRRLKAAAAIGFKGLMAENASWYAALYDRRENGRVFTGAADSTANGVRDAFASWYIHHGAATRPDMRRFEATASYSGFDRDWQLWHSLPCYNEIFYTAAMVRNRAETADMWWQIIEHWRKAARANARETYGLPGMALVHGYLPPIKADRYVHTSVALEYCIETMAQMVKVLWDEWDYGGDKTFLRQKAYPALRDAAIFYANYAKKGDDGYYHFIPSMEAEAWGLFPEFKRARDCIGALCMARWTFLRAAEAAEILGKDAALRKQWLEIEKQIPPYPTFQTANGPIFNTVADTVPSWKQGDHPWYVGFYPTLLADEINLDSRADLQDQMIRTAREISSPRSPDTLLLLGVPQRGGNDPAPEALLNSRGGRIHLFPGVRPDATVAFRRFQARGGFLVSAARNERGAYFVEIEARRDLDCQIMNPWPGSQVAISTKSSPQVPFTLNQINGQCLVFRARRGEAYFIRKI